MRLLGPFNVIFKGFTIGLTVSLLSGCAPESADGLASGGEQSHIIGGQAARSSDVFTRSTVALIIAKNDVPKENCTGTLISSNLVLTAAHCLEGLRPSHIWIHFGEKFNKPFQVSKLVQVRDFVANPEFSPVYSDDFPPTELNDIAVLLLKENAPSGYLPVPIKEGASPAIGEKLLVAGYGHTNDMNSVRAKGLNFARVPVSRVWRSLLVLDQTSNSGVCRGDSGGPAYIESEKGLVVVGITRGAHNESPHCHAYTEFANASHFKTFILEAAQDLGAAMPSFVE